MAHAQKPDFVFRRNGRAHLNRRGRQFNRLLADEVCASAVVMVVMLDTPRSEVVWRVLVTHSICQFPLHFPSRASPCATTFQTDSTTCSLFELVEKAFSRFCVSHWKSGLDKSQIVKLHDDVSVSEYRDEVNSLFRWFIPVVYNYKYTNNISYIGQTRQIYYGVQGQVNDNMFRPFYSNNAIISSSKVETFPLKLLEFMDCSCQWRPHP